MNPMYFEALAALETRGGEATIKGPKGEDSHNLYNIKDFTGKGYRAHDKAEGSNDAYRVYRSRDESTQDLIGLLSRKYPKALEADSPLAFASALKAGGYATDPKYVDKFVSVFQRLSGTGSRLEAPPVAPATPAAPTPSPATPRSLEALYASARGPRPAPRVPMTKTAEAVQALAAIVPLRNTVPADTPADWFTRATDDQLDAEKATREAEQQGVLDIARATFMGTFGGELLKRWARPEFEPDGTVPADDELLGYTVDEQDAIKQGTSRAERDHLRFEIDQHKADMTEAGKSGLGWALLGGLIAGSPEGFATGGLASLALARTAIGSARLIGQGRTGAAAASLVAENVGAELALTAAQDYLTPYITTQDYVLATAGGAVSTALHAPRLLGARRSVEADALGKIVDNELAFKAADVQTARAALGNEATQEQIGREVLRLQGARIKTELQAHDGTLGADRRLISDDDINDLLDDADEATVAEPVQQPPTFSTTQGTYDLARATAEGGAFESVTLRDGTEAHLQLITDHTGDTGVVALSPDGKPLGHLVFMSPDAKLLPDLLVEEGARRRGVATAMFDFAHAKGMRFPAKGMLTDDGAAFHAARKDRPWVREVLPDVGTAAERTVSDARVSRFRQATQSRALDANYQQQIIHAARVSPAWDTNIRGLTEGRSYQQLVDYPVGVHLSKAAAADPSLREATQALNELAAEYLPGARVHVSTKPAAGARGEAMSVGNVHMIGLKPRDGAGHRVARTAVHEMGHLVWNRHARDIPTDLLAKIDADYKQFVRKLLDADPGASAQRFSVTSEEAGKQLSGTSPYNVARDEYMAEQFVKHIEQRALRGELSPTLRDRIVAAIRAAIEFFTKAKAKGLLKADDGADEFFSAVLDGTLRSRRKADELGDIPAGEAT
jgi:hypothetical protein